MAGREAAQIALGGLTRRGRPRGAVLVLQGASPATLDEACSLASTFSSRLLLVAVDGGLKTCRATGRRPDLFVGDGDSVRRPPRDVEKVLFERDKEFSDLSGALAEVRARGVRFVVLAGLVGGRLDHEWANLFELGRHADGFNGILAPTRRGTAIVTSQGCRIQGNEGRTFSLFALNGNATVTLRGARWPLERRRLQPGSHGLSNVAQARLELEVHRGTVVLLLLPGRA